MNIALDKIASVTKNAKLPHFAEIRKEIVCKEGAVLAAKVLEDKKIYNQLELATGRMSILQKGDTIAVALGSRKALKGFVGEVPKTLAAGDVINLLNLGGVAGICTSANVKEVGDPLKIKVLGAIASQNGKSLNIKQFKLFGPKKHLLSARPLVVVSGTCMAVGKTAAACAIIKYGSRKGLKFAAAKLAGVAAMKDTENMKDYGAMKAVSFVDAGMPSTATKNGAAAAAAKGAIEYLTGFEPSFIVIEFGDGLFGEYGVEEILEDKEIQKNIAAHIGCAHDPPGAVKLAEICRDIGAPLDLISGPVTDNSVGVDFIANKLKIPAINALTHGEELFDCIFKACLKT